MQEEPYPTRSRYQVNINQDYSMELVTNPCEGR
jgi:hypothetical protein